MLELNKIHQGDCLELGSEIEPGTVDLILTDLPYGTIEGLGGDIEKYKRLSGSKWDVAIDANDVYAIANRILRNNGKMVLFSQEPYTTLLVNEATSNVPFSYRMMWEKDHFANCLVSKKAPVSYYEDILVFSKTHDHEALHTLWEYFSMVMYYIGLKLKQINQIMGHRRAEHTFYIGSTQFGLCTEETYNELIQAFGIDKMEGFKPYSELEAINGRYLSTFNLWEGNKYKSNILKYKKDYNGFHPTQKPLLLLEDLIKTFSNDGDLVVDLTCGSGSTCVAAQNAGRSFIGIEKEKEYVDIANDRIKSSQLVAGLKYINGRCSLA